MLLKIVDKTCPVEEEKLKKQAGWAYKTASLIILSKTLDYSRRTYK